MLAILTTILGAIVTILGPLLAAGVVTWLEKKQEERLHATQDEADTYITQHLDGNPAGLVSLSHQLERLRDEARRKRRHP